MFPNVYVVERPDRGDPAVDPMGFKKAVFRGLLRQPEDGFLNVVYYSELFLQER